jgi:NAD(P)-dependent dehydrogenase (short-subunit alcohol dehydrogenase family)
VESNRYDGLCRYVLELRALIIPETVTDRSGAASWNGVSRAPQYTASKHGVLGLMRALDSIAAEDNIRLAVIHPWFAGALAD